MYSHTYAMILRKKKNRLEKESCIPPWKISCTVGICMLRYTVSSIRILRCLEYSIAKLRLHLNSISNVYFWRNFFDIFLPTLSYLLCWWKAKYKKIPKTSQNYTRAESVMRRYVTTWQLNYLQHYTFSYKVWNKKTTSLAASFVSRMLTHSYLHILCSLI